MTRSKVKPTKVDGVYCVLGRCSRAGHYGPPPFGLIREVRGALQGRQDPSRGPPSRSGLLGQV